MQYSSQRLEIPILDENYGSTTVAFWIHAYSMDRFLWPFGSQNELVDLEIRSRDQGLKIRIQRCLMTLVTIRG